MKKKLIILVVVLVALAAALFMVGKFKPRTSPATQEIAFLLDWTMTSFYSPYLLADAEGFYAAEGLSITITEGQGAETSAKLIGQGKYPIGTGNAAATAIAVDNGIPVISVAMIEQEAVTAIFSLTKSNIRQPEDLFGKTLGVRYYDISHKEYLAMMKAKGLDPTKVKEVSVGWELQPLLSGQVDALYNYAYNMPVVLKEQGQEVQSILVKDNGVNGYGSNLIANREYAQNHPDVVKRFLKASRKGWELALSNPERAVAVLKEKYPETDTKLALATLKEQLRWIRTSAGSDTLFTQSEVRWKEALATYSSLNMIKNSIQPSDVYSDRYLQ